MAAPIPIITTRRGAREPFATVERFDAKDDGIAIDEGTPVRGGATLPAKWEAVRRVGEEHSQHKNQSDCRYGARQDG